MKYYNQIQFNVNFLAVESKLQDLIVKFNVEHNYDAYLSPTFIFAGVW